MNVMGLQKLTLLDFPGKMACTVFTGGCNFRCPFCHNASLVIGPEYVPLMTEDEFFDFLNKRYGILDGVCITGGEPTLQPDLEEFIRKIKAIGYSVKLDTNGFLPDKLIDLVNKGLVDYVAMDIKSSPSGYGRATGIRNFNITPINRSIEFLKSGKVDFEFRTTVVKELHSRQEILDIGDWIAGDHKYYLQGFEDSGNLINDGLHGYGENEMKSLLNLLKNCLPNAQIRGL
jgi:pyruvate formate lyase activating enzyme